MCRAARLGGQGTMGGPTFPGTLLEGLLVSRNGLSHRRRCRSNCWLGGCRLGSGLGSIAVRLSIRCVVGSHLANTGKLVEQVRADGAGDQLDTGALDLAPVVQGDGL